MTFASVTYSSNMTAAVSFLQSRYQQFMLRSQVPHTGSLHFITMLISMFQAALCPRREGCPQLTSIQEEKRRAEGRAHFVILFHVFPFPSTQLGLTQHVALTYRNGLDTPRVGGFPYAGERGATHFSQIPLEFGAFRCLWL